jgi:hypothetical protein
MVLLVGFAALLGCLSGQAGATNGSILLVFGAVYGSRKHGWLPLSPQALGRSS